MAKVISSEGSFTIFDIFSKARSPRECMNEIKPLKLHEVLLANLLIFALNSIIIIPTVKANFKIIFNCQNSKYDAWFFLNFMSNYTVFRAFKIALSFQNRNFKSDHKNLFLNP